MVSTFMSKPENFQIDQDGHWNEKMLEFYYNVIAIVEPFNNVKFSLLIPLPKKAHWCKRVEKRLKAETLRKVYEVWQIGK